MTHRITDLDEFALTQIWRPFQTMMGHETRLERSPMSLALTAQLLVTDETGWSDAVLDRVCKIGFTFPDYVKHPLVDVIQSAMEVCRKAGAA
jgi:hypothetical protein